jgi:arylsulfatase A-like enzyme
MSGMPQPITRRDLLGALASVPALSAAARRPNIIFVLTDDQGYGDIAAHGNPVLQTPHLDRLHGESVRFTDYHASPTCAPTRSSLMTGRHEFKSGVTHTILERERMSLKATTIAQVLHSAGYATGIFGKWHLGDAAPYQPNRRGFEEVFIHGCGGIGQDYPGTCADAPGNTYFSPAILHNGVFERTSGYCTDVFFGEAIRWMASRRHSGRPFFAYITPNAPHVPLQCPEDYIAMYRGKTPDEDTARYFGMVTNIDDNVGRLMSKLRDWSIERETILFFMTDNGGTGGVKVFNAGMRGAKGTPWEGGTRVPLFARWTGAWKPAEVRRLAGAIDIFPTLTEITGAKVPDGVSLDGRSLLPLLRDPSARWDDRYLFTHVGRWEKGKAAESKYARCRVRNSRFSLVNIGPSKDWQMFDLAADYGESRNVISAHGATAREMEAAYDRWWDSVLPCLENENAVPPAVAPYKDLYRRQFGAKAFGAKAG